MSKKVLTDREKAEAWKQKMMEKHGEGVFLARARMVIRRENVISTGLPSLDWALGIGGITGGRIYEVAGDPSSGKTALTLNIIAQYQKADLECMFIDAERTFDAEFAAVFGVDVERLVVVRPDSLEDAFVFIKEASMMHLVVVDSVSALRPAKMVSGEREINEMTGMYKAGVLTKHLEMLVPEISAATTSVIFINHTYNSNDPNAKYKDPITKGGENLKYNADARIYITTAGPLRNVNKDTIGSIVWYKILKNKMSYNRRKTPKVRLNVAKGFDSNIDLLKMGFELDIIQGSGAWFTLPEQFGLDIKLNGKKQVVEFFKEKKEERLAILREMVYNEIEKQRKIEGILAEVDEENCKD